MPRLHHALIVATVLALLSNAAVVAWSPPSSSGFLTQYRRRIATTTRLASASEDDSLADDDDDDVDVVESKHSGYNVLGTELECCCSDVGGSGIGTGFYRNGYCATGDMDMGRHTVCIRATNNFLEYSKSVGNDLSTPMPMYHFPGLNEGDIWCLCAQRWAQAYNAGKAPKLYLQATHEKTLDYVPLEILKSYAIDAEESNTIINKLNLQRSQLNEMMSKGVAGEEDSFQ